MNNFIKIIFFSLIFYSCKNTSNNNYIDKNKIAVEFNDSTAEVDTFEIIKQYEIPYRDYYFFKKFIKNKLIGKEQVSGKKYDVQYFTKYLGKINFDTSFYYVISDFYTVKCAITWHGHSRIVFLNENKRTIKIYNLNMPDELPIAIKDNLLLFKTKNKTHFMKIERKLPIMICIPESGCY